MNILVLRDRCAEYLAYPYNLSDLNSLDEARLSEALSKLYEVLNDDDSIEGFVKWVLVPLVVVFGESAITEKGTEFLSAQSVKIAHIRKLFELEKTAYIAKKQSTTTDAWEFVNFANKGLSSVGEAFLHAFKFKRVRL